MVGASWVAQELRIRLQCRRFEFNPWIGKIPWRRKWQTTPIFLSGESHGERSLADYSPWYRKRVRPNLMPTPPAPAPPSVQFSRSVMSDSLQSHGLQHARPPCSSPTPRAYSNSCPSHQWCHPTILSSVTPFSSCLQSFPASGSFPMSQFFTSGGQNIG